MSKRSKTNNASKARKVVKVKRTKNGGSTAKFPLSTIAKGVSRLFGIGGSADSAIDVGTSWLGQATGLPIGAQTGRTSKFGQRSASSLISAPAAVGTMSRTPNWDFGRAPDLGCGPGIRVSGRYLVGYIVDGFATAPLTNRAYIGLGPLPTNQWPLQNVVFSPVAPYTGDNANQPFGTYGASDSILQKVAECWTRWRLVDCTLTYSPMVGSNTNKQITIAWVPDPEVITGNLNDSTENKGNQNAILPFLLDDVVLDIPNSVTTPAWAPCSFVIPCDNKSKELLYVNSEDFGPPPITNTIYEDVALSSSTEQRFLFPGGFMITGSGATSTGTGITLGTLFADLTVDLYQLALNAQPQFVAPDGGTAKRTRIKRFSSHRLLANSTTGHAQSIPKLVRI